MGDKCDYVPAISVGVRELKTHLSEYLARAKAGQDVVVTERGRPVARIVPIDLDPTHRVLRDLNEDGTVSWGGGKPAGLPDGDAPRLKAGATIAGDIVRQRDEIDGER